MSQPAFTEHALRFDCEGEQLLGILALPGRDASSTAAHTAMLMVVGGPQYRAGSHRQFTLSARAAAAAGMPVLRFDYRGMGDSSGALRQFEGVEHDIAAAIDALQRRCPSVRSVVLYGLCDAASASLLYWDATHDPRIAAMCLLNPWVRSEAGLARVHVTHYYGQRLRDPAFWRKLLRGEVARDALGGALRSVSQMLGSGRRSSAGGAAAPALSYQQRMARAWMAFEGPVLLLISGRDFTAQEFLQCAGREPEWRGALSQPQLTQHTLADADHTFSASQAQRRADALLVEWLTQHRLSAPTAAQPFDEVAAASGAEAARQEVTP